MIFEKYRSESPLIVLTIAAVCLVAACILPDLFSVSANARELLVDTKKDTSLSKVSKDERDTYYRYTNARYNYSIEFPLWLVPQPEAQNGDGRKFLRRNEKSEMLVFGRSRFATVDGSKLTIKQAYNEALEDKSKAPSKITYKFLGKKSFVVSGLNGASIFYEKSILDKDAIKTFLITYPADKAKDYKTTVERIARSFKSTISVGKR